MRKLRALAGDLLEKGGRRATQHIVSDPELRRLREIVVERHWKEKAEKTGNPILRMGDKFHSQNDEDGIIRAVLDRIGAKDGVFAEFGCGDGLENNTIQLLMTGWRGVWIDSAELKIRVPASGRKLRFEQAWVTRDNCVDLMRKGLEALGQTTPNLVSTDLDGNDLHIAEKLLENGVHPDVFIVEYNAKFPPPIRFSVDYDANRVWSGGDYFGASLQSFVDIFRASGFRLVCCNVTGANAFFVHGRHANRFDDVSDDPGKLFMPPDYNWFITRGHATDPRSIEHFLLEKTSPPDL